jgi:hypothetical protein
MAEAKYRKYFLNELTKEEREKGFGRNPSFYINTDNDIIQGSHVFTAMICRPEMIGGVGHGPHTHDDPEVLVALGMDLDNPKDLGGEIELYMGEDMEKHLITESTLVYIPANFVHCPFRVTKVTRPFIFIQCQYAPKLTETSYKKLVAEDQRDKMVFFDLDGKQTDAELDKQSRRTSP